MARKILVVDDERHIVRLLEVNLKRAGYEVAVAYDGVEALEMVEKERPDLITLDNQMPRMDGFEVIQELRFKPETADIPVVMIASDSTDSGIFKGWQSGVSSYLNKPINPREVLTHIERIFDSLDEGLLELATLT